jgi:Holliday junction resolvase-like predicted endonuclease
MMKRHSLNNIANLHGEWGEELSAEYLRCRGYEIIERNARPVKKDHRLEIDIVAYDRQNEAMVFVEVKQHASHSPYEKRLRSVNKHKKINLLRACNAWRWKNAWNGNFRFDVIEVYGKIGGEVEIDHISHVGLFVKPQRFVRWH